MSPLHNEYNLIDEVNFLPEWYRQQRRRRQALARQFMLLGVMVLSMVLLMGMNYRQRNELELYRTALEDQARAMRGQVTEVVKLQAAKVLLARQVRIYRTLAQPVSYSQIIGTLSAMTPEGVALHQMEMHTRKVKRTVAASAASMKAAGNQTTSPAPAKPTVEEYDIVEMTLIGVAPSDVLIANYIGQIASSPLYENVKMVYSRQGQIDNAFTREFKITLEVPLDRVYLLEAGEVARAD